MWIGNTRTLIKDQHIFLQLFTRLPISRSQLAAGPPCTMNITSCYVYDECFWSFPQILCKALKNDFSCYIFYLKPCFFFFTYLQNNNIVVILVDSKSFHFKLITILRQLNIYESKVHSLYNQPFSRLA